MASLPDSEEPQTVGDNAAMTDGANVEQKYLEAVANEWTNLRTEGGLEIPLTGVYVMLQAIPSDGSTLAVERADVAMLELRLEHTSIPDAERPSSTADASQARRQPPPPVPLIQALKEQQHLVILGEAGAGKSTTLQFVALYFANGGGLSHAPQDLDEERIPILVSLKTRIVAMKDGGLDQALAAEVKQFSDMKEALALASVRAWRDAGRLAVLLDGLDEVPDEERGEVSKAIRVFAKSRGGQRCRVVVASRIAGYQNPGHPFREYTLRPFETVRDAVPYVAGWLAALRGLGGVQTDESTVEANLLVEKMVAQRGLARFLDNPLLLRLVVEIYASTGEIVDSRAALYRRYVEDVALRRAASRGTDLAMMAKALPALEAVAWAIHAEHKGRATELTPVLESLPLPDTATARGMLNMLREQAGLLIYYGSNAHRRVAFSHMTFQEYLVALRLERVWIENDEVAWAFLRPRLHHPAWREPLFLLADSLEEKGANELVRRVKNAGSSYERELHRDLRLAAELIGSRLKVSEVLIDDILHQVQWLISPRRRGYGRLALWGTFVLGIALPIILLPWWGALLSALFWAAVWFATSMGFAPRLRWILRWPRRMVGGVGTIEYQALNACLAALSNEAAVPSLVTVLREKEEQPRPFPSLWGLLNIPDSDVRRGAAESAAQALGQIGVPAVPSLMKALADEDSSVRSSAAEALGQTGDEAAVPNLIQALADEEIGYGRRPNPAKSAAEALGQIGATAVPSLIEALEYGENSVRRNAAEALGRVGDEAAVPSLIQALEDEDSLMRRDVIKALGRIRDVTAVPSLIRALEDEESFVRSRAAEALGQIGDETAVPSLMQALGDEEGYVRSSAAEALIQIGDDEAVPSLMQALGDEESYVRSSAAEALGRMGDEAAVPNLIQRLTDEDSSVRRSAAEALGRIGDETAVPSLIQALADEEDYVRSDVIKALGRIGDEAAVPSLIQEMTAEHSLWRSDVIEALGRIGDEAAVPSLLQVLEDEDISSSSDAIEALGRIGDEAAIPSLIQALNDWYREVNISAAEALGRIGDEVAIPSLIKALEAERWQMFTGKKRHSLVRALKTLTENTDLPSTQRLAQRVMWQLSFDEDINLDDFDTSSGSLFEQLVARLTFLQAEALDATLEPPTPSRWRRIAYFVVLGFAGAIISMSLAVLASLSGAARGLLEETFEQALENLGPLTLAVLVAVLALLIAALGLIAAEIRRRFQDKR